MKVRKLLKLKQVGEISAILLVAALFSAEGTHAESNDQLRRCHWCGPLAEQIHRSRRAPACDPNYLETQVTVCEPGYQYCAIVATSSPYKESRHCVKLYQDECYSVFCNTTNTWKMTCPCRGDLCNGAKAEREKEAFAELTKLSTKPTSSNRRRGSKSQTNIIKREVNTIEETSPEQAIENSINFPCAQLNKFIGETKNEITTTNENLPTPVSLEQNDLTMGEQKQENVEFSNAIDKDKKDDDCEFDEHKSEDTVMSTEMDTTQMPITMKEEPTPVASLQIENQVNNEGSINADIVTSNNVPDEPKTSEQTVPETTFSSQTTADTLQQKTTTQVTNVDKPPEISTTEATKTTAEKLNLPTQRPTRKNNAQIIPYSKLLLFSAFILHILTS